MQNLLEFARNIALEAGDYTLRYYKKTSEEMGLVTKADSSPVTVADKGAEDLMRKRIRETFPEDTIVGEEADTNAGTSGRTWYLDPIDGTKSFIHGVPLYSNLVALWDEEGPLVSVINLPALNTIMWAGRGQGCFYQENGEIHQAHVRSTSTFDQLLTTVTSGLEWLTVEQLTRFTSLPGTLRTWGDGYGYFLVAKGDVDVMVDYDVRIWDIAPIHTIITEAGGKVWSGERGEDIDMVATSPAVFDQVKATLFPGA